MFFLLPILLFAALAVNTLAVPQMTWPLRARSESASLRPRKEEFQLRRTESSQRNFSLPLHARSDAASLDRRSDRTPSPLSPRNFAFPLQAKDDVDVRHASTAATGKVRPRDVFAIRPRIRPRKSDSALIQRLAARQSNDSSDGSLIERGSPLSGLGATIPPDTGLNATILASNGTDITSSFKIMFYHSPSMVALDSLNDRKRQVGGRDQPQTKCKSGTAAFSYSHCTPKGAIAGTTRTFQTFCRERTGGKPGSPRTRIHAELPGSCEEDEICLTSTMEWAKKAYQDKEAWKLDELTVARCISKSDFEQLRSPNDLPPVFSSISGERDSFADDLGNYGGSSQAESSSGNQAGSSSNRGYSGSHLSLRLTGPGDQSLPANIEVDAGEARTAGAAGTIRSHPCADPCMEVSMSDFPENTNWINAHARLTSTLAVAGVLWVALFH